MNNLTPIPEAIWLLILKSIYDWYLPKSQILNFSERRNFMEPVIWPLLITMLHKLLFVSSSNKTFIWLRAVTSKDRTLDHSAQLPIRKEKKAISSSHFNCRITFLSTVFICICQDVKKTTVSGLIFIIFVLIVKSITRVVLCLLRISFCPRCCTKGGEPGRRLKESPAANDFLKVNGTLHCTQLCSC